MEPIPITVSAHAGYKADEYPLSFIWQEREYPVREIRDRWYQADRDPRVPAADYFKVETDCGIFILRHQLKDDKWFLLSAL